MDEQSIFLEALQKETPEERADFLAEACGNDESIRHEVEVLLKAHAKVGDFLQGTPAGIENTIDQAITEKPGTQIGPYKLLQQIGEGGMGVVYLAEQKQPVKRRVALKIIKPGMDTGQVIARFEAERQALAMMDHPNIAKVLDAGATESGRPYFVMELVNGISVTQYCDEQHLTPRERLELFVPICQAVQHAHQKGIIHRDLKPSNVLIALYDGQAVPKVIDFGVAKATNQTLTEKTMFTQLGQIVGTLEYMSPEQAQRNQLDVDTRSDIYSLGVLLYELLTGDTPFDRTRLRSAAFDEMLRIIREEEPSKPSTKVSSSEALPSIAANRRIDAHKLSTTIRGELDWIVMKALEKDRARRYETASKFAEDVQHYLNDEAVVACPPSAAYKFRKFARRNKVTIGTTVAISVALISGIIGTSWQAYEARKERDRAVIAEGNAVKAEALAETRLATVSRQKDEIAEEKKNTEEQAEITQAVSNFLRKDLLGMADAVKQVENEITPDPNIKLRTLLDRAATTIEERFHDRPLVEAAIRTTLGNAYLAIGQFQESEEQHRRALELRKQELGPEHPHTLDSKNDLASSLFRQGQYEPAEKLFRETLALRQRVLGPEHPHTLYSMNNLAGSLNDQHQYEAAEKLHRETLEIKQRVLGLEHPDTLTSMHNLAISLNDQGQYHEAEKLHRETLALQQRVLGPEHPHTLGSINNFAKSLNEQGQYEAAEKLFRETLEIQQRVLGPVHPDTLGSMHNFASSLNGLGQHEEAERLYRETLEIKQRVLGLEHPGTLLSMNNLAGSLNDQHQYEAAEKLHRETLALRQRVLGPEHPDTLASMNNLAGSLNGQGQHKEAEKINRETLEIRERVIGLEHPDTLDSMNNLASSLNDQHQYEAAEKLFRETLALRQRVLGPEHHDTLASMNNLRVLLTGLGQHREAEKLFRETLEIQQRILGPVHPDTLTSMNNLASSLNSLGQHGEAEKLYRETLEIRERVLGPEHPHSLATKRSLAGCLSRQDKHKEAESLLRDTLDIQQRALGPEHPDTLQTMNALAVFHRNQGDEEESEKLHRTVLEIQRRVLGPEHPSTLLSIQNLANCLGSERKDGEAVKLHSANLEIRRRVLGPEHPDTLLSMHDLAVSLYYLKNWEEAAKRHRETLEIRQRVLGAEHTDTLISKSSLALCVDKLGDVQLAETLLRETLEVMRRVLGSEHFRTRLTMHNLATNLNDQGKCQDAEKLHRECLGLRKRVLGAEHPDTLISMHDLAVSLYCLENWEEAEALLLKTLKARQRVLGVEHPQTLDSLQNLALVLKRQDRFGAAEKLIREAVEASRRVLGADHRATLIRLEILGQLQFQQGQIANAADTYREALERHRQISGNDHLDTLKCQRNLAVIFERLNKITEALSLFRQSFEGSQRTLGKDAPWTIAQRQYLVTFLTKHTWHLATAADVTQRNPAEAVCMGRLACELQPDSANNWNNLGVAHHSVGDYEAALEALTKADAMTDGGDRIHRMFLAMTLHQLGRTDEARQRYVEGAAWIAAYNKKSGQPRFRREAEELLGLDAKRREELIAEYYSDPSPVDATVQYWSHRGRWHSVRGEYEQMVSDLTHAIELETGNSSFHRRRGEAFTQLKRWDEALIDLNEAIRIDPEDAWAHVKRSESHRNLNHLSEALADAKQAIKLNKRSRWAWQRLAHVHEAQQEWGLAAEAHGKFFDIEPDDSSCWIPYANALLASGQLEEYRTFCTELIERNADTEDPRKARLIIFCLNKAPDAVEDWTVPLRLAELVLASEKPSTNHVSLLFVRAGQYRRSIELQEKAIQAAQRDLNAWGCLRMGLAHHGLGELEKAQSYLAQADKLTAGDKTLTEDPNYQKLHREVSELLASKTTPPKQKKSPVTQTVTSKGNPEK